jgi:hypothetical protein
VGLRDLSVWRRCIVVLLCGIGAKYLVWDADPQHAALAPLIQPLHAQTTSTTVVLWSSSVRAQDIHGAWTRINQSAAAGGAALDSADLGSTVAPALVSPANYFEIPFTASAGVPYHLWIRMRAESNSRSNDSVHVQFSDSTDAAGSPIARIGTAASAQVLLQDGPAGARPHGWGWADNGYGTAGTPIYFAASGRHVVRIQHREDGAIVDQIVLSPDRYFSTPPGPVRDDTTILQSAGLVVAPPGAGTTVVWASHVPSSSVFGDWRAVSDSGAAGGAALHEPNASQPTVSPALAGPLNYFEATFAASAGTAYHVWMRMRADANATANDSVHLQFSDSTDAAGQPTARIGTTSSMSLVLRDGATGANPLGWGWTDNGAAALGANVYFAATGTHTLRVQQREDGITIDQVVISSDTYLTASPGFRWNDVTILPERSASGNVPPSVALTSPRNGAAFTAPATIPFAAMASDPENRLARVEFFAGATRVGTSTAPPYAFNWTAVPAGSYTLSAIAYDADGARTPSSPVTVTVNNPAPPPPQTWTVMFTASANHASVTSYRLDVFASGANPTTAAPIASIGLGKPTPNGSGEIALDESPFVRALSAGSYLATVSAIGTGGESRSTPYVFSR